MHIERTQHLVGLLKDVEQRGLPFRTDNWINDRALWVRLAGALPGRWARQFRHPVFCVLGYAALDPWFNHHGLVWIDTDQPKKQVLGLDEVLAYRRRVGHFDRLAPAYRGARYSDAGGAFFEINHDQEMLWFGNFSSATAGQKARHIDRALQRAMEDQRPSGGGLRPAPRVPRLPAGLQELVDA